MSRSIVDILLFNSKPRFRNNLHEALSVVSRPVPYTGIQYTPVDKVEMIFRKGPWLLEIIDLKLRGINATFSSFINRPEIWNSYFDVGRNPTGDDEIILGIIEV